MNEDDLKAALKKVTIHDTDHYGPEGWFAVKYYGASIAYFMSEFDANRYRLAYAVTIAEKDKEID